MMYMHYCKHCHRIHMLNGHKISCPKCAQSLVELRTPYMTYVNMDMQERNAYKELCRDEDKLRELTTTYRMYKYSKWYREQQFAQAAVTQENLTDHTHRETGTDA